MFFEPESRFWLRLLSNRSRENGAVQTNKRLVGNLHKHQSSPLGAFHIAFGIVLIAGFETPILGKLLKRFLRTLLWKKVSIDV